MKRIKVTKTINIYNKESDVIKEVDVTNLPWKDVYTRAILIISSSLYGYTWKVIVEPQNENKTTDDKG